MVFVLFMVELLDVINEQREIVTMFAGENTKQPIGDSP